MPTATSVMVKTYTITYTMRAKNRANIFGLLAAAARPLLAEGQLPPRLLPGTCQGQRSTQGAKGCWLLVPRSTRGARVATPGEPCGPLSLSLSLFLPLGLGMWLL